MAKSGLLDRKVSKCDYDFANLNRLLLCYEILRSPVLNRSSPKIYSSQPFNRYILVGIQFGLSFFFFPVLQSYRKGQL